MIFQLAVLLILGQIAIEQVNPTPPELRMATSIGILVAVVATMLAILVIRVTR